MTGRWPANVVLSPEMARALDEQSGHLKAPASYVQKTHSGGIYGPDPHGRKSSHYGDEGGASRFFLNAGYEPWELEWILASGLRPCGD